MSEDKDFESMAERIIDQEKQIAAKDAKIAEYETKIQEYEQNFAAMNGRINKLQGIIADNISVRKEPEGISGSGAKNFADVYHDMIRKNSEINKRG